MTSTDKDFRFMATNDLMTELQKDSIKLDDESERKVAAGSISEIILDQGSCRYQGSVYRIFFLVHSILSKSNL